MSSRLECVAFSLQLYYALAQVMPFILRRTKDAVLKDLPPKILQVALKPLQSS